MVGAEWGMSLEVRPLQWGGLRTPGFGSRLDILVNEGEEGRA